MNEVVYIRHFIDMFRFGWSLYGILENILFFNLDFFVEGDFIGN